MSGNNAIGVILSLLLFTSAAGANAHTDKPDAKKNAACEKEIQPLFKVDVHNEYGFAGILPAGAKRLERMAKNLPIVVENYNRTFEGMGNILLMNLMAMAGKQNVIHLGEPGGAKTGNVLWMFKYPEEDGGDATDHIWHIQMHEMRTEGDIFGLPTADGIARGLLERNTENSVVRADYGLIDEITTANPAIFGSLLSFMNPGERFYEEKGRKAVAKTRTIFSTGNSTRAQMMHQLWERLITTGPAFLNRSLMKSWVPNWLTLAQQDRRNRTKRKMIHLKSIKDEVGDAAQRAEARELLKGYQSRPLDDMAILEHFAYHAFVVDEALDVATIAMANNFRELIAEKVYESHEQHKSDPQNHPFTLMPAAELTERLRDVFEEFIKISAMIDYVDLMGWDGIKNLKQPIVLKPMSLWRLSYILTTLGGGLNVFDPHPDRVKVSFELTRNQNGELVPPENDKIKKSIRDPIARQEFENKLLEQEWFNNTLKVIWDTLKDRAQLVAKELAELNDQDPAQFFIENQDLEVAIYKMKMKRGY